MMWLLIKSIVIWPWSLSTNKSQSCWSILKPIHVVKAEDDHLLIETSYNDYLFEAGVQVSLQNHKALMDAWKTNHWLIREICAREITAKDTSTNYCFILIRSVHVHICIKAVSLPSKVFVGAVRTAAKSMPFNWHESINEINCGKERNGLHTFVCLHLWNIIYCFYDFLADSLVQKEGLCRLIQYAVACPEGGYVHPWILIGHPSAPPPHHQNSEIW